MQIISASHGQPPVPRVALLATPGASIFPVHLATEITRTGIALEVVHTPCSLYRLLLQRRTDVVLVGADVMDDDGQPLVRNLRAADGVGIIAGLARQGTLSPSHVVDWGADTWITDSADADTIIASIRSLSRRIDAGDPAEIRDPAAIETQAPPRASGHWRLDSAGWCLITPDEQAIALTSTERAVVAALIDAGGSPLSREELMQALDDGESGTARRRLEMLVFRLRRKVQDRSGLPLPLLTARGNGYLFLDHNAGAWGNGRATAV